MTDEDWPTERVVRGWWTYGDLVAGDRETRVRLERGEGADMEEVRTAQSLVWEAVRAGGVEAVELVRALARCATDDDRIGRLAAGPVGDLVTLHGTELAGLIADAAAQDQHLAEVLRYAWVGDASLEEAAQEVLLPWIPHLDVHTLRAPARPRKGRRWKDRAVPGADVSRYG
ncbi:DUF6869 domain-containing protein [Cellulomonas cellasea]|uniref:DUF6869 domain-containing protein n=1 Tax=Cellulomonas cellasea TaxID=43670 RepID=A0A7W4UH43_9CELL|nr:hypothetical protein [Cellulomonas cellasea]MBB2924060.1 hypothetical protein [Cellulomonas cellasea]